jgi:MEDS: MEthanogen/methylotroph, DcmR Sensory domain
LVWRNVVATEHGHFGHVVQFYGHEEELADRVAAYLLEALDDSGVAIVIATQAHRRAFEARLTGADAGAHTGAGTDLDAAVGRGAYLALDADETVRALMTGDRLDGGAFEAVIGGLIRRAGQDGSRTRPVSAYGEMVALLWDAGLVSAAVELEQMWDRLVRRHPFSLFCGYPAQSVIRDGHLDAFAEVCRLHREVLGPWSGDFAAARAPTRDATRTFAFSREAPADARHFAVDALPRLGAADLADDAALVVTELAANAIVHARSGFTVDLAARPDLLRISVRDASPPPAAASLPAAPLHGLGAVDALASRWGVERLGPAGKAVWVELRRPSR